MKIVPLDLKEANELVARYHRHHKPVVGHRFSVGLIDQNGIYIGAAICGRPVARGCDQRMTLEITRLVTNGEHNGCSALYGACARIAKEMGYQRIQTYILQTEPGTSLRAAGWQREIETAGGSWSCNAREREDQHPLIPKVRWAKALNSSRINNVPV
jgi:hypothetical protein